MASYNKRISDQSKIKFDPINRELIDSENSDLDSRVDALETTVGDSSAGLVKDVNDLQESENKIVSVVTNPDSNTSYNIPFVDGSSEQNTKINDGLNYITSEGNTETNGLSLINLGNSIASGNDNNKYGILRLYGYGSNYAQIMSGDVTGNKTLTLPNKSGTLATIDDVIGLIKTASITGETNTYGNYPLGNNIIPLTFLGTDSTFCFGSAPLVGGGYRSYIHFMNDADGSPRTGLSITGTLYYIEV